MNVHVWVYQMCIYVVCRVAWTYYLYHITSGHNKVNSPCQLGVRGQTNRMRERVRGRPTRYGSQQDTEVSLRPST